MFCIVSEGVLLAIYPLSHNTPPEAARGKPGAVQTWVLTAHPESAQNGLFNLEIDLFGALCGVPPIEGPLEETEGDFIDIYVVRGMFCIASEGFYSLFTSFAGVFRSCRRRCYRYLRRSRHVLHSE